MQPPRAFWFPAWTTAFTILLINTATSASGSPLSSKSLEAQLYEDLLFPAYNKVPRPVKNSSDLLTIDVGSSLIRIIDVDEKNQVLTTNLWLEMRWTDSKLQWKPEKYGDIRILHIPSSEIWTPDFVLYNNAAGDPDITIFTDALVTHDGRVYWQPPGIYKSFCSIDVTWFPYDVQNCTMKFGAWSYTGFYVDLRQLPHERVIEREMCSDGSPCQFMQDGMDLSFFYKSAEWDLLELTSERHTVLYASCCGPEKYVDITYRFILRRKTLFFTCNLIIPCFLISFLTTFVFYLSGSFRVVRVARREIFKTCLDHKITFSISILVTLTVFFLVLIDIMPPTSLVIPMFGRYLITTMCLVALSTMVSVVTVNFRFRSGAAHQMSPWIKSVFLTCLPKLLFMKRPERSPKPKLEPRREYGSGRRAAATLLTDPHSVLNIGATIVNVGQQHAGGAPGQSGYTLPTTKVPVGKRPRGRDRLIDDFSSTEWLQRAYFCPSTAEKTTGNSFPLTTQNSTMADGGRIGLTGNSLHGDTRRESVVKLEAKRRVNNLILRKLLKQVRFIAEHFRRNDEEAEISDDWTFVGMVLDRLFLIIFSCLNMLTFTILIEAPSLYDRKEPLEVTAPWAPLGQANLFKIDQIREEL